MTDTKEGNGKGKQVTVVKVPVTVVLLVPIEIDIDVDDALLQPDDNLGVNLVDANQCEDAANQALIAAHDNETVQKAFDGMLSAALRFKEAFPGVDICASPFAGLVPETRI